MNVLKRWIDDVLGMMTMYRIVLLGLAGICLAAFGLMLTNALPYSPLAFLASIVIVVAGTYGTNRLFGWLFGVRPHSESAIITGLIVALLFMPPTNVISGVKLLLVVTIAMASKYVLAVRGKHVFNPAAIAIVIASVGGLAYATWWIATPLLLPVSVIVAAIILYKTQKLLMAGVFLAVAMALIVVTTGSFDYVTLTTALTSWPLVFFAGVMLSEPQTLPPRRNQQLLVACVVAVLMVLPLHYASVTMTPALALVCGNLLAFYFGVRRGIPLRLVDKKRIGTNGYELTFDTKPLPFIAGQYIELSLPHSAMDLRGMRRVFTIIGRPGEQQLSIATRLPERSSSFKRALMHVKIGQTIHATRVAGDFVLSNDTSRPIVFVAGGIGITPFISFLRDTHKRTMTLLYVVASPADTMFVDELQRYDCTVVVISAADGKLPDLSWQFERGSLTPEVLQRYIPVDAHPEVYVSGPLALVDHTKRQVKALGISTVHTDHFTGY